MITAIILAGGLGTRLQPILSTKPKVLAPVAGRRFLAYLLDKLADHGIEDVVLSTGHMGNQVQQAFGGYYRKLRLHYSLEKYPLGTAGAIRNALPLVSSEPILILN